MNKRFLASSMVLGSFVALGVIFNQILKKIRYLKEDVSYQLVERIQERLANVEKQLFLEYERKETRENLHRAIVHITGWDFLADVESLSIKLSVSLDMLNLFMIVDPEGKLAYMECRDILKECVDLIEESEPKYDIFEGIDSLLGHGDISFEDRLEEYAEKLDPQSYRLDYDKIEMIESSLYPWLDYRIPKRFAFEKYEKLLRTLEG